MGNVSVTADYAPHVPEFVNVKVNLVGAADNLVLQVKECFATPSDQSNDTTSYTFIEEYCAVDTTIADLVNAESDDATFSIEFSPSTVTISETKSSFIAMSTFAMTNKENVVRLAMAVRSDPSTKMDKKRKE